MTFCCLLWHTKLFHRGLLVNEMICGCFSIRDDLYSEGRQNLDKYRVASPESILINFNFRMKKISREPWDKVLLEDVVNVRTAHVTLLTGDTCTPIAANWGIQRPVTAPFFIIF